MDDDLLPISALQHLRYCARQCALIHIERLWAENRLTIEGRRVHRRVHGEEAAAAGHRRATRAGPRPPARIERRGSMRIVRGLPIASLRLGLFGVADLVEFHDDGSVVPVEYKRGKPKRDGSDEAQLCAQALCLEETLAGNRSAPTLCFDATDATEIESPRPLSPDARRSHPLPPESNRRIKRGAIHYARLRSRADVAFTDELRRRTEEDAGRLRDLIASGITPRIRYDPRKCDRCSLKELCLPTGTGPGRSVTRYISRTLASQGGSGEDDE